PWTVRLLERIQEFMLADKARFSIIKKMSGGEWCNLTSLWRVAKKERPIGIVGVGMILNNLQEDVGLPIFETGGPLDGRPGQVDSVWRVRDDFMGIIRAVVSSFNPSLISAQSTCLESTLNREHIQAVARSNLKDED
ncbi:MAG: hypothetical protein ACTSUE_13260, partial [Promethearchaeota archaeon]